MIPLTLAEIAAATGGALSDPGDGGVVVTGPVVVDSRVARPGALFVALPGERTDGHHHVGAATAGGAVGVLASRPVGVPAVLVEDGVAALGRLATEVLHRLPGLPVVGITGSQGKTGTKDLLAAILGTAGPTVAPPGSFNNEVGLPLTVLRADATTTALVLEMGARRRGHIAYLTSIAPPLVGVVLNVGVAHLGEFGSREAIAQAKGELVEALPPHGTAALNADDPLVAAMAARTRAPVLRFGLTPAADVHAGDVRLDERARASFTLNAPDGTEPVRLRLHGRHQVGNALAAAAAATALGLAPPAIAAALCEAGPASAWRMEVADRADGVTVVNDAYNANPDSVRAALETLLVMAAGRSAWAVLGEMRELGPDAAGEHEAIGRQVAGSGIEHLVVVGEAARALHEGAVDAGAGDSVLVPDAAAASELLRERVRPGDVVLVKASRAAGLDVVAAALLDGPG